MSPVAIKIINNTLNSSITIKQYHEIVENKYDHADKYDELCKTNNIQFITFMDKNYPTTLKKDPESPAIIFYQGDLNILKLKPIAIVGARDIDIFSQQIIADCVPRIASPIISGMAYGVDIVAHKNALDCNKLCIAVLPCGILQKVFYPKENYKYISKIINSGGLVISQLLPDSKPLRYTFIQRNRLIVQLSRQVWIVKAALKSGTLTTASFALELRKKLLVSIHNQYDEGYKGNYELLSKGAKALITPDYFGAKVEAPKFSVEQKAIIKLIKSGFDDIDSISEKIEYTQALKTIMSLVAQKAILDQDGQYVLLVN
jgi:DNA processing protein